MPGGGSRRSLRIAIIALGLMVAAFVDRVHLGYEIRDTATGTFRSQYDAADLVRASADRAVRWRVSLPPRRGFAREDHYFSEGLWHVEHRNGTGSGGDMRTAWHENLILEKFFRPVLDLGFRWPQEQFDANAEAAKRLPSMPYVSYAAPYPIFAIDRRVFWSVVGLATLLLMWVLR
jgi:hypothetical protein